MNETIFNGMQCSAIKNFSNITLYRYQIFQISEIVIINVIESDDNELEIHILENGSNQLSFMFCNCCTFFLSKDDAKKKQTLDIHKMLQGSFKSNCHREQSIQEYFREFIDQTDFDFFISSITNQQLHENEYYELLNKIFEHYPELII